MRKFLRDVIIRAAEMIKERESAAELQTQVAPGTSGVVCRFCRSHDHLFQIVADNGSFDFACSEHIGPFIAEWMVAPEVTVVRL